LAIFVSFSRLASSLFGKIKTMKLTTTRTRNNKLNENKNEIIDTKSNLATFDDVVLISFH